MKKLITAVLFLSASLLSCGLEDTSTQTAADDSDALAQAPSEEGADVAQGSGQAQPHPLPPRCPPGLVVVAMLPCPPPPPPGAQPQQPPAPPQAPPNDGTPRPPLARGCFAPPPPPACGAPGPTGGGTGQQRPPPHPIFLCVPAQPPQPPTGP